MLEGDLRVCTYCGKVVLSYLQSADMGADLSADLRALQEDLQTKFGNTTNASPAINYSSNLGPVQSTTSLTPSSGERDDIIKRKPSVGYQEEKFVQARLEFFVRFINLVTIYSYISNTLNCIKVCADVGLNSFISNYIGIY